MTDEIRKYEPVILTGIGAESWEHPADRAALAALRRIPAFDEVLRKLFGFFGEKPVRLAFQANAVRVGPRQFPDPDSGGQCRRVWHERAVHRAQQRRDPAPR
ncbi:MAG: hypothetical protein P8177_11150 [Gemmatimonadota bacterium]